MLSTKSILSNIRRGFFFICCITLHQLKIFRSAIAKKKKKKDMDPIYCDFPKLSEVSK